ncbi:MAG: class I SAM-dependent methyltransferase [Planctomycetota bacterium]
MTDEAPKEFAEVMRGMIDRERNLYELAELFPQKRRDPAGFLGSLWCPACEESALALVGGTVRCEGCGETFPVRDRVIDFRPGSGDRGKWEGLNEQFLKYHRSLSVYTLLNGAPINNYVSARSGIGELSDVRVLDVGGGTGHVLGTFFRYPETIDYTLLDPNLRLLHDQFVRLYPALSRLPMSHVLGFAETLPFREGTFDVVMSISSIDHFRDYGKFVKSAHRVLAPGGRLLISSHLDIASDVEPTSRWRRLFTSSTLERVARRAYFRKHRVGDDDHTYHFEDTVDIARSMTDAGFTVRRDETFSRYFLVVGEKA